MKVANIKFDITRPCLVFINENNLLRAKTAKHSIPNSPRAPTNSTMNILHQTYALNYNYTVVSAQHFFTGSKNKI